MNHTVYLKVKGMHCPQCPTKVEKSLAKLDGVSRVKVELASENGVVTYNKKRTNTSDIINRINDMGFEATSYKEIPSK